MNGWIPWIAFNAFVLLMLAIDLGVLHRKTHVVRVKEALVWSAVCAFLALLFAGGVWRYKGRETAMNFLAGYVIEQSLSVDNLFVFLVLFSYFKVQPVYQHRVLFWGILGALVMRATMILAGTALIHRFHWIMYVFGAFLVLTGVKLAFQKENDKDVGENIVVRLFRKIFPVTPDFREGRFFVVEAGRRLATPMFLVLLTVEVTDLVFALDSIPAIFAVTTDPFIVYTSNVFAILGLRSLYFALAGCMGLFVYLKYGLSVILAFVGVKMLMEKVYKIPIGLSLGVIVGVLALTILASLLWPPRPEKKEEAAPGAGPGPAPGRLGDHALLPLDGSPEAERAVDVLRALRPPKVTILHVADGSTVEGAYFTGVERRLKEAGTADVAVLHCSGDPSSVILQQAKSTGAAFVALSMHGRGGWDLLRLGTVAERVLRASPIPVLAVPKATSAVAADPLERVLAPLDGSEAAEKALGRLVELFPKAKERLHLLSVVEAIGGPEKLGGGDVTSRFYQLQADDLKARMDAAALKLAPKPEVRVDVGRAPLKILEHAAALGATMIAMAPEGRGGLSRWTLGSVTEQVLRASQVPVLVLR
jgi:tellurite resistance protein TerC